MTMIGFITTEEISNAVTEAIRLAQTSRGLDPYWLIVGQPIDSGEYAGQWFIPCDDDIIAAPLYGGKTPVDFPEFDQLISLLGGMSARVEIEIFPTPEP